MALQRVRAVIADGLQRPEDGGERRRGPRFDVHVNQYEPLLVQAAEEVLQERDVAAGDVARRVEPNPVVQRIGRIGENGRAFQPPRLPQPTARRGRRGCAPPARSRPRRRRVRGRRGAAWRGAVRARRSARSRRTAAVSPGTTARGRRRAVSAGAARPPPRRRTRRAGAAADRRTADTRAPGLLRTPRARHRFPCTHRGTSWAHAVAGTLSRVSIRTAQAFRLLRASGPLHGAFQPKAVVFQAGEPPGRGFWRHRPSGAGGRPSR